MSDKIENNKIRDENTSNAKNKVKKKKTTYDGLFKDYMDNLPDEIVKKFLFYLFGLNANIDLSGELARLQQETFNDMQKRVCDLFYRIGDFFFCIELQLINDKYMALRIFQYSFRGAILHGVSESKADHVTVKFPAPAVIYLQNSGKVPDKINMDLDFAGTIVKYEAKVRKLADYEVNDLFDQYAFPLMTFYPLKYEKSLRKKHTAALEKKFIGDMSKMIEKIGESVKNGIIEDVIAQDLINSILSLIDEVSENGSLITDKEVLNNMQQLRTIEVIDLSDYRKAKNDGKAEGLAEGKAEGLAEGKAEGLAEGKAEGLAKGKAEGLAEGLAEGKAEERRKNVMSLSANGFTPSNIAKLLDIPAAEVKKIISGNRKESNGLPEKSK